MIDVQCVRCGTRFRLDDQCAGRKAKCPTCGRVDTVPGAPRPGRVGPVTVPPPLPPARPPEARRPAPPPNLPRDEPIAPPAGPRRWLSRRAVAAASAGVVLVVLILGLLVRPGRQVADSEPPAGSDATARWEGPPSIPAASDGPAGKTSVGLVETPSAQKRLGETEPPAVSDRPVVDAHAGPSPGPPDRREAFGPRPKNPLLPASRDTELTGASRRYDNLECQQIQARHAIRVPAGATILEVDGQRLPVARPEVLAAAPAPYLFLPRGSHAVCFRPNDYPVPAVIQGELVEEYESMRRFFGVGNKVKMGELVARAARTMDTHSAPFLVNFMGAHYAAAGQWDVAERKFRRALGINPAFGPAHLNLAECLLRRTARDEAIREVLLAEAFNVGNVFGLAGAIAGIRQRLAIPPDTARPIDLSAVSSYVAGETPTEEDRRITAILEGLSKYAVRDEDRAKILNNLAIHFAESGRPELALHHFHQSLAVVRQAGEGRFELARKVFGNIKTVCRKAGFAEADEYEQMETLVLR